MQIANNIEYRFAGEKTFSLFNRERKPFQWYGGAY
jgi:hypothetical protein